MFLSVWLFSCSLQQPNFWFLCIKLVLWLQCWRHLVFMAVVCSHECEFNKKIFIKELTASLRCQASSLWHPTKVYSAQWKSSLKKIEKFHLVQILKKFALYCELLFRKRLHFKLSPIERNQVGFLNGCWISLKVTINLLNPTRSFSNRDIENMCS